MTIKIYGPTASRAARALWIVHELGIPFEHVAMEMKDLKGAEYLKINPNGKVPALVDGDFKLFESMAINLYLAAKHGKGGFFPASLEDQGFGEERVMRPHGGPAFSIRVAVHLHQRRRRDVDRPGR